MLNILNTESPTRGTKRPYDNDLWSSTTFNHDTQSSHDGLNGSKMHKQEPNIVPFHSENLIPFNSIEIPTNSSEITRNSAEIASSSAVLRTTPVIQRNTQFSSDVEIPTIPQVPRKLDCLRKSEYSRKAEIPLPEIEEPNWDEILEKNPGKLCPNCSYVATDKSSLKVHYRLKHMGGAGLIEICKICHLRIKTKGGMKKHYINVHHLSEANAKQLTWNLDGNGSSLENGGSDLYSCNTDYSCTEMIQPSMPTQIANNSSFDENSLSLEMVEPKWLDEIKNNERQCKLCDYFDGSEYGGNIKKHYRFTHVHEKSHKNFQKK